jgi:hypothetical protein
MEDGRDAEAELDEDFEAAARSKGLAFEQQNTPEENALIARLRDSLEPLIKAHENPAGFFSLCPLVIDSPSIPRDGCSVLL